MNEISQLLPEEKQMILADFLRNKFNQGLEYEDAVCVCMAIYSTGNIVPAGTISDELSMEQIAVAFSDLAKHGLIKGYSSYKSVPYGANYHCIEDKGHWIEIQASLLKLKTTCDGTRAKSLLSE